jgi:acyl carrier protein phosphodiesterase
MLLLFELKIIWLWHKLWYFRGMNYLAHIFLSGDDDDLKIGNFIADSVKGKDHRKFPDRIEKGILLHRSIDSFTDHHPLVFQSSHRLFPHFRHYSSVVIDMLYDHFLADNWTDYSSEKLSSYAKNFYGLIDENFEQVPERVQNFFPYMKEYNWLVTYAELKGLEKILTQMTNRVVGDAKLNEAIPYIKEDYPLFKEEFTEFFEDLKAYVEKRKIELEVD